MTTLKGSKTEANLKAAFAGEFRPIVAIYISLKRRMLKAIMMSRRFSGQRLKAKPAMRMAIWSFSRVLGILQQVCQSARQPIISKRLWLGKRTNIPTCTPAWRVLRETRDSMRLQIGLKP